MDHYQLGLLAFCDQTDGQAPDYISSAKHLSIAYEEGSLNAGWLLAHCYSMGFGVPRDLQRAEELARELISRGCEEACFFLSKWNIVNRNNSKAEEYSQRALSLSQSGEGRSLDDILWTEFCFLIHQAENEEDMEAQIARARRYYEESRFHLRYVPLASSMITRGLESDDEEIENLLDAGCAAADENALYLRGLRILNHPESSAGDRQRAEKLLERSILGDFDLAAMSSTEKEREAKFKKCWQRLRWGFSKLRRPQELDIDIELIPNNWSGMIRTFDQRVTRSLMEHNMLAHAFEASHPLIRLSGLTVGQSLDIELLYNIEGEKKSFTYTPSAEQVEIDLRRDHGWEWADLALAISDGQKDSYFLVGESDLLYASNTNFPHILLCWRRSMLLGYVLQIYAVDKPLNNIVVHLSETEKSEPFTITPGKHKEIGWKQMPSRRGPRMGRPFVITVEGYAPMAVVIAPPPRGPQRFDCKEVLQLLKSVQEA